MAGLAFDGGLAFLAEWNGADQAPSTLEKIAFVALATLGVVCAIFAGESIASLCLGWNAYRSIELDGEAVLAFAADRFRLAFGTVSSESEAAVELADLGCIVKRKIDFAALTVVGGVTVIAVGSTYWLTIIFI